ncbi:ATP-dependent RecD-like DNA helicase [bacterium]|nr:ATP-dependent RecD-like DNA helicase [bacterium]
MPPFRPKPPKAPSLELIQQNEFAGHYRHVTHESEDGTFRIVTFVTEDGTEFKAKGNFYGAGLAEPMRIRGQWRDHPKFGWSFSVESFVSILPTTADAISAWLGSGLIKGLGPKTAQRIVDHFGEKTLDVLDSAPELLREVKGVSEKQLRRIVDQWEEHKVHREAMLFLKSVGLTNAIATRLIRHYGENAAAVMRQNPYQAGLDVRHIGFMKADEIAARLGIARDSPQRVQAAYVHLLDQATGDGHTYLPEPELLERARTLLNLENDALLRECLTVAAQRGYVRIVDMPEVGASCFLPSLYECEKGLQRLVSSLERHARPIITGDVDEKIREFERHYRFSLAPQQQDAIRAVAAGGVVVITGGPGTGKTTLVRGLLHVLRDEKIRVALCSPTGRAAQRLSETTGQEAATVHRLLKWNAQTGGFTHGPDNRLPADLLIVDESSMLDVPLAFSLLSAVLTAACVVFVGDVDQLPSVGPGTFLRDLIASPQTRVARLEVIFRQGRESLIVANSHRINAGQSLILADPTDKDADFFFVQRDDVEKIIEGAVAMVTDRIPKKLNCDPVDDIQLLTPMRVGALGTMELNRVLQERLNPNGQPIFEGSRFRVGDKIIQSSNNYDLDVFNGDVGRILGVDLETKQARLMFGRRVVLYPFDNLDDLDLAYAITIHKSQGSEYKATVIVLHTSHYVMLRRNLVYTAVTRGKKLVVVVGSRRALFRAIGTAGESERRTALATWLSRPPEKDTLLD